MLHLSNISDYRLKKRKAKRRKTEMTCLCECNGYRLRLRSRSLVSTGYGIGFALALFFFGTPTRAEVRVVTTTQAYVDITRQIGGQLVSVESVMIGPENVHNVSPTPGQMMKLKKADL